MCLASGIAFLSGAAQAQDFPTRPVVIVVASSPGGPTDAAARMISDSLAEALGQPVVIENVAGAGGTVAMGRVARAAPDGYTLLVHQNGLAIAPALYSRLTFDTEKAFVPVGLLNRSDNFIVGRKTIPAKTFPELVGWMKQAKQPTRVAHPGIGTNGHLQTTMLMRAIGADNILVAYKGIAPAVTDLLGEHVDLALVGPPLAAPHVRAGNLTLFMTTGQKRNASFPDVPTVSELGHPELQVWFWHALFAPAGTPGPVLDKLNGALKKTLAAKRVRQNYANALVEAFPDEELSRDFADAFLKQQFSFWASVVRDNNIKAE